MEEAPPNFYLNTNWQQTGTTKGEVKSSQKTVLLLLMPRKTLKSAATAVVAATKAEKLAKSKAAAKGE